MTDDTIENEKHYGYEDSILRSLRRITRAIDLYSRQLSDQVGLTGPQLVSLRALARRESMQPTALAREIDLSPATITGIIDRLVARDMVTRVRSTRDRRVVNVAITAEGRAILARAPSLLQDRLAQRLAALPEERQELLDRILAEIVEMMGAGHFEVAAMLTTGPLGATAAQISELLESEIPEPSSDSEES